MTITPSPPHAATASAPVPPPAAGPHPQPPGQPPYGPPAGMADPVWPAPAGRRRKGPLVVLALLAAAAVGGAAYIGFSDGDDSGDHGGPESAVRDFVRAAESRDCDRAVPYYTADRLMVEYGTSDQAAAMEECEEFVAYEQAEDITRQHTIHSIEVESSDGVTTTVLYEGTDTVTQGSYEEVTRYTQNYHLVEVNGEWLIDAIDPPVPTS